MGRVTAPEHAPGLTLTTLGTLERRLECLNDVLDAKTTFGTLNSEKGYKYDARKLVPLGSGSKAGACPRAYAHVVRRVKEKEAGCLVALLPCCLVAAGLLPCWPAEEACRPGWLAGKLAGWHAGGLAGLLA